MALGLAIQLLRIRLGLEERTESAAQPLTVSLSLWAGMTGSLIGQSSWLEERWNPAVGNPVECPWRLVAGVLGIGTPLSLVAAVVWLARRDVILTSIDPAEAYRGATTDLPERRTSI